MLRNIDTLKMEGSLSPKEKLLAFKLAVDKDGFEPTRVLHPGSTSKHPAKLSVTAVEQTPSQLTSTGRRDHRGLPIMSMAMSTGSDEE